MLKYIIAMTHTALPPVLVIGIFLIFYAQRLGTGYRKPLGLGFALGLIASLILVLLKKNTGFVVREYYNLAVLIPCLVVELLLIIMIWLPRRSPLTGLPEKTFKAIAFLVMTLWVAFSFPDILFYPFDFSVGMDTVFNTRYAYKVIGWCVGGLLSILVLFAVAAIVRQFSVRTIKWLFQAVMLIFMGRQLVTVLQIIVGRNLVKRTPWLTGLTIDMLNHAAWFLFALMAICGLCAVVVFIKNKHRQFHAPNPALLRKLKASARRQKRWCTVLVLTLVAALLFITVGSAYENQEVVLDPPKEVSVRDGRIFLPLETIDDGKLHRFKHNAPDGTEIRYIVIKKNETAFGVGLDACDICGASGYYERNDQVICILCDVVMNKSTIGFPGGCNPVPLAYRVEEGSMVIEITDLEKDVWRFKE